jgi:hypothetical protein
MLAVLQIAIAAFLAPSTDSQAAPAPAAADEVACCAPTVAALQPSTFQDARYVPGAAYAITDTTRRKSVEYSDGYYTRLRIHKIASWFMLPLFIGSYATGTDLLNNGNAASSFSKNTHGVFAGGTAVLFALNTVTGVWNLVDSRHDPNGRTRRWVHSILMFVAEAGFVATGATAPSVEHGDVNENGNATAHKTLAITSMSIATASWLMMLIWK